MRTQGHLKPYVSKQAGRPDTAHKPGKGKKILKTAGKVFGALLSGGLILTSFSANGQTPQTARDDGQDTKNIPVVASANVPLPVPIYNATGEDFNKSAAKVKPGTTPTDDPKQKWCEGYEVKDGTITFKGVKKGENRGDAYASLLPQETIEKLKSAGIDYTKATNENVKFFSQQVSGHMHRAYFIVEIPVDIDKQLGSNIETLIMNIQHDTRSDSLAVKTALFETKVFSDPKSVHIGRKGEILVATDECIEIIEPGREGKKTPLPLSKLIGTTPDQVPPMTDPTIYEENGWYVIKDPIIKDGNEMQMKIVFKINHEKDSFESGILPEKEIPL